MQPHQHPHHPPDPHQHTLNTQQLASTFQQMRSHHKLPYFFLYATSYSVFGMLITALGPMFPYLAATEGRLQTDYSFLFTCRALGFVAGAMSIKFLAGKLCLHHLAALGTSFMGVFAILFYLTQHLEFRGLFIFFSAIGCAYQDVILNLAALECFEDENTAIWLQLLHGFFGIGGLIGPFLVYLFQLHTLTVIGILALIPVFFYFYLHSPQHNKTVNPNASSKTRSIPQSSIYLIAACFFFTVGQQTTYGGWVSSYAVLNDFSTKEHATVYSSLYWISITGFRFILAVIQGSSSKKIEVFAMVGVGTGIVGYFITLYVNSQLGLFFMSIMFGLANSLLYALLLTVPQQYGFKLTVKQTISFVMWASLGEGCLAVGVGQMMGWFSYNWLIWGMVVMDFIIMLLSRWNTRVMEEERERLDGLEDTLIEGAAKGKVYELQGVKK